VRITSMCLRNLLRRRVRTSLCVFGVALGIMFILAVGGTTMRYVTIIKEMNVFYTGDVVVVARGSIFIEAIPIGSSLQENTVVEVRQVEGVKTAVPMLFVVGSSAPGSIAQFVPSNITVGIPVGNWSVLVGHAPLMPGGRWPSANSSEKEVVIGVYLAQLHNLTVNSGIRLKNHNLRVVGILDTPSVLLARTIIMPLKVAQEIYGYGMSVGMVVVEPLEGVTEEELADRIEAEILGVTALTGDERNAIIEPILRDVEMWNLGIRGVLFSLSMVLVMTVAIMNVSERKKELATLDAIGASKSYIVRMVITETGLIGLFGGILGVMLGTVAALLVSSFYSSVPLSVMFPSIFAIVPPTMMLEILASTVAVSCVAGVIPAIIVARKSIVELLRSEH